ncbi:hypothetical protein ACTD5D_30915 [Nocardia takedensis]|uniref:hypothetical protein n=1 Tax=Nocardia takedensis TaxID=259390 RepID=UPI003F76BFE9
MSIVYFAHSYRERDAAVVDFFARLIRSEGLSLSLDPPSDSVNSAKLQRHLNASDGMIAVLSRRDDGVSPHILYEINLAVKTGTPLLVFVEDTIPNSVLSQRLAQQRFSARWYLREVRDHRHALQAFKSFMHDFNPPKFRPSATKRACVLVGLENLPQSVADGLREWIECDADYDCLNIPDHDPYASYELLRNANVAVALQGSHLTYADGLLAGIAIPTITLSERPGCQNWPPLDYQPRLFTPDQTLQSVLRDEFEVFEQDFLDLPDQQAVDRYASALVDLHGVYDEHTRSYVQEVVMGDKYTSSGQAIQGPNAHVHDVSFQQSWNAFQQQSEASDLPELAAELEQLRQHLRGRASTREEDAAVADVGAAATAAEAGDGPGAMSHLAKLGTWALGAATAIGTALAAAAIKSATGL